MITQSAIITQLHKRPEGIRCCVAQTPGLPGRENWFHRGVTGILMLSRIRGHLAFLSDEKGLIHFRWAEWKGLHIPDLGIYRF